MVISSILWIPAGIPDPNPKKYDSKYTNNEENDIEDDDNDDIDDDSNDVDIRVQSSSKKKDKKNKNKDNAEDVTSELSLLPPELRMDEYSDDDDDDDKGIKLGKLLISNYDGDADFIEDEENEDEESSNKDSHPNKHVDKTRNTKPKKLNDDDETDDEDEDMDRISNDGTDDDEDDLHDVPDTREYMPVDVEALQSMKIGGGSGGISNKMVIRRDENGDIDDDDIDDDNDSASEIEDTKIMEHDAMIIVAKTEDDDYPLLEIHIYDTMSGNLYVHHDIPLPSYPLCLAHGRIGGKNANSVLGNYCAVGTFNPTIEIWNLDVLNPIEPSCILGTNNQNQNKKYNNKNKQNNNNTHTDAILSLSWNTYHQNVLASGSADHTIKLWDIQTEKVASTLYHHSNKVQSLQWNPIESTLLASGSYDHTISLIDARTCSNSSTTKNNNSNSNSVKSVNITSDCECISWDPNKNELLTVIEENGYMTCWDVRQFNTSTPLWKYKHSIGITEMSYNQHIPGLLVTSNIDKNITLWDTYTMSTTTDALLTRDSYIPVQKQPKCIITKDMCAGKLYNVSFYSSLPWLLACGGSGNTLSLWDLSDETSITSLFTERSNIFHNSNNTATTSNNIKSSSSLVEEKQQEESTTAIPASTKGSSDMNDDKNDNDIDDHNDNDTKKTKKNKKPKAKKNKAHKSGR